MTSTSQYDQLLNAKRRQSSTYSGRTIVEETESDRARVLFSSPFRRLQQKTQVFPLENNAAVRSRLTHSIEVAQIGRFIAVKTLAKLAKANASLSPDLSLAFSNLVETVCLIHDIGNPPFGHFGEAAIADWFRKNAAKVAKAALGRKLRRKELERVDDFSYFDGNAQGFRIVTRLQWNRDPYGLNLTYSCLASYLKYCYASPDVDPANKLCKKPGYFLTELPIVNEMWSVLGMTPHTRFPLAYVMEAADDIAFCVSDIEDGIEKGLISERDFFALVREAWETNKSKRLKAPNDKIVNAILKDSEASVTDDIEMRGFMQLRTKLNNFLCEAAADSYVANHELVLAGTAGALVETDASAEGILEALRQIARTRIYSNRNVCELELAGLAALHGILDLYEPLLRLKRASFEAAMLGARKDLDGTSFVTEVRLCQRLPRKHCREYHRAAKGADAITEWIARAHLVIDYVSGMTDDFAISTFQRLAGLGAHAG